MKPTPARLGIAVLAVSPKIIDHVRGVDVRSIQEAPSIVSAGLLR